MELFALRCPWHVAGPIIGLLIVGLLWAINKPLGALGGYIDTGSFDHALGTTPGTKAIVLFGYAAHRREAAAASSRPVEPAMAQPGL
jgi:hypothetical protein